MNESILPDELINQLRQLGTEEHRKVLEFARSLAKSQPTGVTGQSLLTFAGLIPSSELELMQRAIEEGCEKVRADEW